MVERFLYNHYEVNSYLIIDEPSRECAIVDPACASSYEDAQFTEYISQNSLIPKIILLTHAHVDHIAGLRQACEMYHLPVTLHPDGKRLLRQAEAYGSVMGFAVDAMDDLQMKFIDDGDVLHIGKTAIECRYVPGHCPGSMCFVVESDRCVLTGDALFHFNIGRCDLPGGDYPTLISKIKQRLLTLPDEYIVKPGHGIESQIGKERQYNPYLQ